MRAQAVVFPERWQVEFTEIEVPDPEPYDVVVDLTHSWISPGTERSFLRGERSAGDTPWTPGAPDPFPIVAGYQKVGRVTWAGPQVPNLTVGDMVFASVSRVSGMYEEWGGHVSPSVVPFPVALKLPTTPDALAFSGLVLTQVGYNCGSRPPVSEGTTALVLGDGLVGHWAAQTLALRGADVLLAGRHPERLARFADGDRRRTVDVSAMPAEAPFECFGGDGPHIFVDTAGSIEAMGIASERVRQGGHLVSAGFYGSHDELHLQPARLREVTVHLVSGSQAERLQHTLELVASGDLQTLPLITHHFPASEAEAAWRLLQGTSAGHLGVILDW